MDWNFGEHINVIRDFGAKGDGTPGDAAKINEALNFWKLNRIRQEYRSGPPVYIPPVDAFYNCEDSLYVDGSITVYGAGGRNFGGSFLKFAPGKHGIVMRAPKSANAPAGYPGQWGANFAAVKGLRIESMGAAEGDPGARNGGGWNHGFMVSVPCHIESNYVGKFPGDGYFFNGYAGNGATIEPDDRDRATGRYIGSTNCSHIVWNAARECGGNGFRWLGNNANACHVAVNDATRNGLVGFLCQSQHGQTFIMNHAAQNAHKVGCDGVVYGCMDRHESAASNRPGTGADWQKVWQVVGSVTPDEEWQEGRVYYRSGSYHSVHATAQSLWVGNYSETGIMGKAVHAKNGLAIGGSGTQGNNWVRNTEAGVIGTFGASWPIQVRGGPEGAPNAWQVQVGGHHPASPTPNYIAAGHVDDAGDLDAVRMTWSQVRKAYEWGRKGIATPMFAMTSHGWTGHGYSGPGHAVAPGGLIIQGGGRSSRVRAAHTMAQITGAVVQGDLWILTGTGAAGPHWAKCVKSGTVGVDAEIITL